MSISFARVASGTTTLAGTNAYSAYTPQPTITGTPASGTLTGQDVSDYNLLHVFTKPYLDAHTLSYPSFRYSYYLWFALAAIFVVWTLAHQTRWRVGAPGLWLRKLGMQKWSFGSHTPARQGATTALQKGSRLTIRKWGWTTPTVSQLVGLVCLLVLTFCLCYIGPDYVYPTNCLFSNNYCGYVPVNGDNATNQFSRKFARALSDTSAGVLHTLSKRRPARYGWSPLTDPLLAGPNYEIDKSFWTSSSRVGLIAYALLPLSVALALKQWPMNLFATPFLTNLSIDRTAIWHRWVGRLIWAMSTVHTGLWTKQLFIDINPFNEPTWNTSWAWHRLLAGGIAYGLLTAMVAFSFKPLRNRYYEIFYYSHVVLVLGFLVTITIHYQALQGWSLLAACLWGLERLVRFCVFLFLNYGKGIPIFGEGRVGKAQFTSRDASSTGFRVHNVEKRISADSQRFTANTRHAPTVNNPYGAEEWSAASASTHNLQDVALQSSESARYPQPVYAYGPGNDDVRRGHRSRPSMSNELSSYQQNNAAYPPRPPHMTPLPSYQTENAISRPIYSSLNIPKGYALAQVLPGRVIRLTIHTLRHVSWKPGQHVMLTIPSVRWWQGHPYSIVNAQDFSEARMPVQGGGSEIVLLISARKGFTKHLYQSINNKRKRLTNASSPTSFNFDPKNGQESQPAPGVLIRAQTYLPNGSASRVRWDDFSSVVIVAAGTGVTYAMCVLEHLCHTMAEKDALRRGDAPTGKSRKTKPTSVGRVRFVWILREYAHLAWIAPALRKCMDISDPSRLRIDLFVTSELQQPALGNALPSKSPYGQTALMPASADESDVFQPPRPGFARHTRGESFDSMSSDTVVGGGSVYSAISLDTTNTREGHAAASGETQGNASADFSVTDMILFDGEAEEPSPVDQEISKTVRKEGKVRRALSRKMRGRSQKAAQPVAKPTHTRQGSRFAEDLQEYSADETPAHTPSPTPTKVPYSAEPAVYPHQYPPHDGVQSRPQSGIDTDFLYHKHTDYEHPSNNKQYRRKSSVGTPLLTENESAALDMDDYDRDDLNIIAELARGGKPDLDAIIGSEIERSQGKVAVTSCGPPSLNDLVRRVAGRRIDPRRVAKGDARGHIEFISEDFYY